MGYWQIKILYDGQCPICRKEADLLRWLDGGRGRLLLEDITGPRFDPGRYGLTLEKVMGQIHGILPSGRAVTGMAVFRRAYDAVGLGWMLAPTNWPLLRGVFDKAYAWFAHNRLWLTRRSLGCSAGQCGVTQKAT